MKLLVIDIGGTNVKVKANNLDERRKIPSGDFMTPERMVSEVIENTKDWEYEAISIGYPGIIKKGKIMTEPKNLGDGWVGFDFDAAFGKPVRIINDAAMQALGSYREGVLLFLGLGTGMGSALVVEGKILPMELAHLSYRKGTFEDYLGLRGLERLGQEKWQRHVWAVVARFKAAFLPDDVVLGGGNSKLLTEIPANCRLGNNHMAIDGGFRLWEEDWH
ncbi:ROK family protein [Cyclobacteriaceae bacterium YHN15]|nr:ROK family protein [Cyclobacteriaceae bacterium YHN15]